MKNSFVFSCFLGFYDSNVNNKKYVVFFCFKKYLELPLIILNIMRSFHAILCFQRKDFASTLINDLMFAMQFALQL
jgi:hypothetical protein